NNLSKIPDAPGWLAVLACFNDREWEFIQANPALAELLEATESRAEWRSTFDTFQENERRLKVIEEEREPKRAGESAEAKHGYIGKALDVICAGLLDCKSAQNAALFVAAASAGNLLAGAKLDRESDLNRARDRLLEAAMRFPILDPKRPWNGREGRTKALATI